MICARSTHAAGAALLLAAALAAGCGPSETDQAEAPAPAPEQDAAAPETAEPSGIERATARLETSGPEIAQQDLEARIAILADDSFEGRAPSTEGGRAASQWIADEMARIGLEPAFDGSYFQTVPLIEATMDTAASRFTVTGPEGEVPLQLEEDIAYWSGRSAPEAAFEGSEIVFAGYGAVAPEYGWDDYAGLDAAGKTILVLVNDPGFATEDPDLFTGRAMTYYGRWSYKMEEAGRQGADAIIVIHETEPASYGWNVVSGSGSGANLTLDSDAPRAPVEAWINHEAASRILAAAGLDYETLKEEAARPGFTPVTLDGVTAAADLTTTVREVETRNVGGLVRGAERPDETVIYSAHWDHLGVDANAAPGEDAIFNGAEDNATGVAGILEIGEAFAKEAEPPARSVMILAVTAEESGLLGSDYYAEHPSVPLSDIVAAINIDAMAPQSDLTDMAVRGYGASELEDILGPIVESQGRALAPDPSPEAGAFYRSDHISFAKRGVPALYAKAAPPEEEPDPDAVDTYHTVHDELTEDWTFDAMLADLEAFHVLGMALANTEDWPNWYAGNEFRALRDGQRAGDNGD